MVVRDVSAGGRSGVRTGGHRRRWGFWTPVSEDGDRQIEGIGRPSIVRGPDSQVGRYGSFEGEKRKLLSVVLLIHGKDDTVVNISQSRLMEDRLRGAGKNVKLIQLKGEDHWLSSSETRLVALETVGEFLAKYLKQ